jgi:WD40 repeat protein
VSASSDGTLQLWDLASLRPLGVPFSAGYKSPSVTFSPDGTALITEGNAADPVRRWEPATGRLLEERQQSKEESASLAASPDGKTLVLPTSDYKLRIWGVPGQNFHGEPLPVSESTGYVTFSPDGKTLAYAAGSNNLIGVPEEVTVRLWDVVHDKPRGAPLRGHTGTVSVLAFSPDGETLASGSEDTTVRLWSVADAQPLGEPLVGHSAAVVSLRFSPDGKLLATGVTTRPHACGTLRVDRLWESLSKAVLGVSLLPSVPMVRHSLPWVMGCGCGPWILNCG